MRLENGDSGTGGGADEQGVVGRGAAGRPQFLSGDAAVAEGDGEDGVARVAMSPGGSEAGPDRGPASELVERAERVRDEGEPTPNTSPFDCLD